MRPSFLYYMLPVPSAFPPGTKFKRLFSNAKIRNNINTRLMIQNPKTMSTNLSIAAISSVLHQESSFSFSELIHITFRVLS